MAGKRQFEITERDVIHYFGNTLAGRGNDYQRAGRVDVVGYDPGLAFGGFGAGVGEAPLTK
ncbi:MAG: hypothetical protein IPJ49_03590 [Candidatus Obscuribacter sp.]|nr:hypothetical protein [Candidatus Obscuribacter sp.]